MIYVIVIASIVAIIAFVQRSRVDGIKVTLLDLIVAASFGWLSGIFIGIGARIGMWAIPFFNGGQPSVTLDGTLRVILAFSLYGIGLGILYEFIFRDLLRRHGSFFGVIVALVTWYPLGAAGAQQLSFTPSLTALVLVTGAVTLTMFVPFAVSLEHMLERWHRWHDVHSICPVHAK